MLNYETHAPTRNLPVAKIKEICVYFGLVKPKASPQWMTRVNPDRTGFKLIPLAKVPSGISIIPRM
jgi:hypothetical protein